MDKLPHIICNDCAIKIDNFHNFALFAQKNQEIFNRINAERIYQEHCKSLSSLNTTLYREPPLQPPHQVALVSTEDITIFAYNDLKLGQLIKDAELLKLILRALKWEERGETLQQQLDRLKNTSFRAVLNSPDLLQDEDLMLLLGPYLDKNAFGAGSAIKAPPPPVYGERLMDPNIVTEMEVGVDPELFLPYDDDETKSVDYEEIRSMMQVKRNRKVVPRKRTAKAKLTVLPFPQTTTIEAMPPVLEPQKIEKIEVAVQPSPAIIEPIEPIETTIKVVPSSPFPPSPPPPPDPAPPKPAEQPQLVQRILQKSKEAFRNTRLGRRGEAVEVLTGPNTRARSVLSQKYKCSICNKKLSTKGNLNAHMRTHKPKGKFVCDKCGRIFKTQVNLQRHKDYHARERFTCRTCGRVYPSNSTLKQHEISHSNSRPHKCNICSKMFKRNQDLKFHINQHTGERPFKCPFCPRAFASSGNCFSHRKRLHSDEANKKMTTRKT